MRKLLLAVLAMAAPSGAVEAQAPAVSLLPRPNPAFLADLTSDGAPMILASLPMSHAEMGPISDPVLMPQTGPATSIRPRLRPAAQAALGTTGLAPAESLRPKARAAGLAVAPSDVVQASVAVPQATPIPVAEAPVAQPTLLQRIMFRAPLGPGITEGARGALCGDPGITGESIAPVVSRVRGCGIPQAVKVTAIAGVRLSTPATIDCATALALKNWVTTGLKPAVGSEGGGVASLTVFGSYECRSVDGIRGAKISLHGQGKAIDIAGYTLANGKSVLVASDWRKPGADTRAMKVAYHAACGIFGTTLGPDGDRFHQTHMHFDTAQYTYGAYCH